MSFRVIKKAGGLLQKANDTFANCHPEPEAKDLHADSVELDIQLMR